MAQIQATRWGIVSAGKISQDFVLALKGLPRNEHEVVAIGARKLSDAQEFAKKHDISKAYGSYEEVAKDPDVDVVYVGTIHPYHHSATIMLLNNGKPVLCEKPLGMNYAETKEMIDLAKEKGLFFMEGLWSRFFPAYEQLRKELKAGTIGKTNFVSVNFGGNISHVDRLSQKALGGGCILDLGIYPLQLLLLVYDHEEPEKIVASGILNDEGVDYYDSVTLYFKDKRAAQFNVHQGSVMKNHAVISGEKGVIEIPSFWCPDTLVTPEKTYTFPLPDVGKTTYNNSSGFQYEAQAVRECLLQGKLEHELHSHAHTLLLAKIMENILNQVGVVYK